MKKPVTYLGDAFFHGLIILTIIIFLWVVITPAKYFLWEELKSCFQNRGEQSAKTKYNEFLVANNLTRDNFNPEIIIRKKYRELTVYSNNIAIASYPIGLGRSTGRKQDKDDMKTPEGQYYICNKNPDHTYHMFLQINYPSSDDANRATVNHIISTADEIHINQAEQNGNPPPADTNLGGNVGIHGFGAESSWTKDGSVSMHNADMEELYWNIPIGCPVTILP